MGLVSHPAMNGVLRNASCAVRQLRRAPFFASLTVATIALAIGGNTLVFGVLYGVLLRPLAYPDPGRLVILVAEPVDSSGAYAEWSRTVTFTASDYAYWKERARSFESGAIYSTFQFALTEPDEVVRAAAVSDAFFATLGIDASIGRSWRSEDGVTPVAVISDRLWRRRYASDPKVLGRSLELEHLSYSIVGVMPPHLTLPSPWTDVWVPLESRTRVDSAESASQGIFTLIARLKPGVTREAARADVRSLSAELRVQRPQSGFAYREISVVSLQQEVVRTAKLPLLFLMLGAGLVLLMACANLGTVAVARAVGREAEFAIRAVLGADGERLLRQVLTEGLVLVLIGAAAGVLLAWLGLGLVRQLDAAELPRVDSIRLDSVVLGFACLTVFVSATVFGLVPAIRAARVGPRPMSVQRHAGPSPRASRWQRALVVVEIAVAVTVLAGAGVFIRSFLALLVVRTGAVTENVATGRVELPADTYGTAERQRAFFNDVLARVRAVPGVQHAGVGTALPPDRTYMELGISYTDKGTQSVKELPLDLVPASPGFLEALGVRLIAGRTFDDGDSAEGTPVVILSERAARQLFGAGGVFEMREAVIDHSLSLGRRPGERNVTKAKVVGVISDVRYSGLNHPPRGAVYVPFAQRPWRRAFIVVKASRVSTTLLSALTSKARAADAPQTSPVFQLLDEVLNANVLSPRFRARLAGALGALGVVLAAIGLYGLATQSVAERRPEIAVRVALGARPSDILWLVLTAASKILAVGTVAGLVLSMSVMKILNSTLFGAGRVDPVIMTVSIVSLVGVFSVALFVPARRAARVEPAVLLRL